MRKTTFALSLSKGWRFYAFPRWGKVGMGALGA